MDFNESIDEIIKAQYNAIENCIMDLLKSIGVSTKNPNNTSKDPKQVIKEVNDKGYEFLNQSKGLINRVCLLKRDKDDLLFVSGFDIELKRLENGVAICISQIEDLIKK